PSLRDHQPDLRHGGRARPPFAPSGDLGAAVAGPAGEGHARERGLSDARGTRSGAARPFARPIVLCVLLRARRGFGQKCAMTISEATAARRRGPSPALARVEEPTRACTASAATRSPSRW